MCAICGCSGAGRDGRRSGAHGHVHGHEHGHEHGHGHDHGGDEPSHGDTGSTEARTRLLEIELLAKNDRLADQNRRWLAERGILALNLIGSPGAGKTTLLEQTARWLRDELEIAVLEGDQETDADAERIRAAGCRAHQINTGAGCHLDAKMVREGLEILDPSERAIVFFENVGNLVCPALFDLGERAKVVILSATEGEDKPLKYPHIFRAADVVVLNKIDLLPYLPFDIDRCISNALEVKPSLRVFRTSTYSGEGIEEWCGWLSREAAANSETAAASVVGAGGR